MDSHTAIDGSRDSVKSLAARMDAHRFIHEGESACLSVSVQQSEGPIIFGVKQSGSCHEHGKSLISLIVSSTIKPCTSFL